MYRVKRRIILRTSSRRCRWMSTKFHFRNCTLDWHPILMLVWHQFERRRCSNVTVLMRWRRQSRRQNGSSKFQFFVSKFLLILILWSIVDQVLQTIVWRFCTLALDWCFSVLFRLLHSGYLRRWTATW